MFLTCELSSLNSIQDTYVNHLAVINH